MLDLLHKFVSQNLTARRLLCWVTVGVNINKNSPWQAAANELVLVIDDGGNDGSAEHPALRLPHHPQQEDL